MSFVIDPKNIDLHESLKDSTLVINDCANLISILKLLSVKRIPIISIIGIKLVPTHIFSFDINS